jgi:2-methylcitrate dehydratase PrpD
MAIELGDGRVLRKRIEHAIGSLEKPMSNADLERKFADLADGILPKQQTAKVMELCWKVEGLSDAGEIARTGSRPGA